MDTSMYACSHTCIYMYIWGWTIDCPSEGNLEKQKCPGSQKWRFPNTPGRSRQPPHLLGPPWTCRSPLNLPEASEGLDEWRKTVFHFSKGNICTRMCMWIYTLSNRYRHSFLFGKKYWIAKGILQYLPKSIELVRASFNICQKVLNC